MTDDQRIKWMRRLMSAGGVVLFVVTWKLWTPQTDFPQIPFSGLLVGVPGWFDWVALTCIGGGLLGIGACREQTLLRIAIFVFVVAAVCSVALNQHRLQPWVFLLLIHSAYLLTLRDRDAIAWTRWTIGSVYIFSAVSKLDYQFVFTVGKQMLGTLSGFAGWDVGDLSNSWMVALVLLLPLSELLVGVLLLIPKTRMAAGGLAMVLHLTLLVVLGPLGLDHQLGVLVWNLFFVFQAWLLFVCRPVQSLDEGTAGEKRGRGLGRAFGVLVIAMPATCLLLPQVELPVRADHWVAWEVYAPRSSRAEVERGGQGRKRSLGELSLKQLGVPVYPQARFQAACLVSLGSTGESGRFEFRRQPILISKTSDRMTGGRQTERLDSEMAWQRYVRRHWLNLQPRQFTGHR
jgi:hypothetical protein